MRHAPTFRWIALPFLVALAGCSDPEPERPNAFGRVDGVAYEIQSYALTLNDAATQIPLLDARLKVSCDASDPRWLTEFYAFIVVENAAALPLGTPIDASSSSAPIQVAAGLTDRNCYYEDGSVVGTVTLTSFSTDTNIVEGSFNLSVTNLKTFTEGCDIRPPIGKVDLGWTAFSTSYAPSFCGTDE